MSSYGLRKKTSRIQRADTITDLRTVNSWRYAKGLPTISPRAQSVRKLENAVALSIKDQDLADLPKLVRGTSFYQSIINEIKETKGISI